LAEIKIAIFGRRNPTSHWTRGETACLIKTSFGFPEVVRSGFARVNSGVIRLSLTDEIRVAERPRSRLGTVRDHPHH